MGGKGRKLTTRTKEEKQSLLNQAHEALKQGLSLNNWAKTAGVSPSNIYEWRRRGYVPNQDPTALPTVDLKKSRKPYTKRIPIMNPITVTNDDFVCVAFGPRDVVEKLLALRGTK